MSDAYTRVTWRGHTFNKRTVAAIREVERRLGSRAVIYQGSYSTSVSASAGTHAGGGAVDLWFPNVPPNRAVRAMRNVGWAAWERGPTQGFTPHIHAVLIGDREMSSDARLQVADYVEGGDGLWPLVGGDDTFVYRPNPPVVFSYPAWLRARTLRQRIAETTNDIQALRDKRAALVERLDTLT